MMKQKVKKEREMKEEEEAGIDEGWVGGQKTQRLPGRCCWSFLAARAEALEV